MRIPIFSGKGFFFLALCLGKTFASKTGKGGVLNQSPQIWGVFQMSVFQTIYAYAFPESSIASREKGIRPLLHYKSVVGPFNGSDKIFPEPEEKKRK